MKIIWLTARQREDTIFELKLLRESLLGVMHHSSQAQFHCINIAAATHFSWEWAASGVEQVDSLIEQVRRLPVRDETVMLSEPQESEP